MQIKMLCSACQGTGHDVRNSEPPVQYECRHCDGVGYHTIDLIGNELADMQTDITKILRRVKKLMDKLAVEDD